MFVGLLEAGTGQLFDSENIKAMTTKHGGQIVCPKRFLSGPHYKLMTLYDVRITSGFQTVAILDFLFFQSHSKLPRLTKKNQNQ